MKVTIIGAGAIGGLAGAYMTRAGYDVTLVDRWREHVDALNERGRSQVLILVSSFKKESR